VQSVASGRRRESPGLTGSPPSGWAHPPSGRTNRSQMSAAGPGMQRAFAFAHVEQALGPLFLVAGIMPLASRGAMPFPGNLCGARFSVRVGEDYK